jgi:hypothetical protein
MVHLDMFRCRARLGAHHGYVKARAAFEALEILGYKRGMGAFRASARLVVIAGKFSVKASSGSAACTDCAAVSPKCTHNGMISPHTNPGDVDQAQHLLESALQIEQEKESMCRVSSPVTRREFMAQATQLKAEVAAEVNIQIREMKTSI